MVRLKYTWLIDTNVIEVNKGDEFAIFTTTKADESIIEMRNSKFPMTLTRDSTIQLMFNLNFKVANTETLRFYPSGGVGGRIANETTGQKGNLNLSSGIVSWQPQNFGRLFYDLNDEFGNEKLTITDSASLIGTRTILQDKLKYSTSSDNKMMTVVRYPFNGNYAAAQQAGISEFQAGNMSSEDGKYRIIGWQGEKYVAVKNKTSKLSRLVIEQGSSDKKTVMTGDTWDIGQGWRMTVNMIDARSNPRVVWFTLSKDGTIIHEIERKQGEIYTYVTSNHAGELNVPLFVTYVDAIFSGPTSDMAQFKYTWAIDTNVTSVRTGDWYGVFKVTGINSSTIELRNTDYPISLDKDSTVNLMGNMGLKVADSDTLRFYPYMGVFPACKYSMISGHMFEDNNVNGLQEPGEPGMVSRTVSLKGRDICSNVNINMKIQTDAAGYYEFGNIRAGTYFLSEEILAGWIPTTQ
jgi:S-layer protein (TIGR01567 family)